MNRDLTDIKYNRQFNNNKGSNLCVIVFVCIVVAFTFMIAGESKADNTNDTIESLRNEKNKNQEEQSSVQEEASQMADSMVELETMVENINKEIESINSEISKLDTQISDKNVEISNTKADLDEAEKTEKKQYEDMKLRIRFMYEMGDTTYLDILFSGGTIADTLNKIEYVDEVVSYDRKKVDEYKAVKEEIQEKKEELESEKTELESMQTEEKTKHEELEKTVDESNEKIKQYAANIEDAEAKLLEYEKKIEQENAAIYEEYRKLEAESIAAAEKAEQESIAQAKKDGTYVEPETQAVTLTYNAKTGDVDKLAALIECEAANQPYQGKLAVGAVVVNRIASSRFPNTLTEVIEQPYQFTPVLTGRYRLVLARGANEECYRAAREVLEQGHIVGTWIYFRTINGHPGDIIGDHVFYSVY